MGKKWDRTGVANDVRVWAECLRVLKPGGHLVAFGGTRTYHRMVCAIEDAGFEVRDQLGWLYGSGFPKSLDVSKAIDKAAGAEREVVGSYAVTREFKGRDFVGDVSRCHTVAITAPATDAARQWQGWGTALKPAWEPIVLARKPLVGTVAENVLQHGTGALNIDGCRVRYAGTEDAAAAAAEIRGRQVSRNTEGWGMRAQTLDRADYLAGAAGLGRWPANIVHDGSEEVLAAFPEATVAVAPVTSRNADGDATRNAYGKYRGGRATSDQRDGGGSAARFFYCAKADRADRNAGLYDLDERAGGALNMRSDSHSERNANHHPTVKPTDLMRWLCRLITPPGGTVLDPFMGSGSTLKAAELEGFSAIGIELNAEYIEIARRRIASDAPLFSDVRTPRIAA